MLGQLLVILGISLSVSFVCSILEAVLLSVTHGYVHVLRERGSRAGLYLEGMQKRIDEPIAAILTLNTVAHTVGAAMGGAMAVEIFGSAWIGVFSAVLTFVILLFTEIVPKTLGATYWIPLARPTTYVLRGMIVVMKPILAPLGFVARVFSRRTERPTVSRRELEVLARIGRQEGALDEDEWRVVRSVMSLDEVTVGEVMTPRTDIVAVPAETTVEEAMASMLDAGHLRLPVYEETLDRIVGILLARDLWRAHREGETELAPVLRPPQFAPVSKPAGDLIREMRDGRVKMVMVVDEFGGTAGLVTLEDLLEEIVGEIQDEHEADEPEDFLFDESGDVRIWGGVALRDVSDTLELALPEDQYDTIAGYVLGRLDRIPRVGDRVEADRGVFRVVKMRGRRIEFLLFSPSPGS